MSGAAILFEQRGPVAWITLNRPEAKNTLAAESFVLLRDAWSEVRTNRDIRVAVVTGAGDEDFCCGGDLGGVIKLWTGAREPVNEVERELVADPEIVYKIFFRSDPLYKPVVAAINGRALGGGCELLLTTDVRIASSNATFGLPEPQQGLVPGAGSMARLARQIPHAHAMKLLLTGDAVDAQEALAMGLVSEVVPPDRLLARADELAQRLAANAPLALQAIKRTVLDSHTETWEEAFRIETEQTIPVMASQDAEEGPRAFKEKRDPVFRGE